MKFNPDIYLPFFYGTIFKFDDREETLYSPVLEGSQAPNHSSRKTPLRLAYTHYLL
jgi:hypothetical protein